MTYAEDSRRVAEFIVPLYGEDPFADVRLSSDRHREEHAQRLPGGAQECGVFPSGQVKMRLIATLVRLTRPARVLEIGCGLGYSALWLARAAGREAMVETIDRFPEHAEIAAGYAKQYGLGERVRFVTGEGAAVLAGLGGPYDFVHDDGWFAQRPPYVDRMVSLVRPGGVLVLSNWFLLVESLVAEPSLDWAQFGGPRWTADVQAYAREIAARGDLDVSFVPDPGMVLAVKRQ